MPLAFLITGATGNQGSAVINALLAQELDVEILAVTRNPHSSASRRLTQRSAQIKLVQGDLDHPAQIFENAKKLATLPISGVFSVQNPFAQGQGVLKEEHQGKALIDEALAQHIPHFVYSSVDRGGDASSDNPTTIPHFRSKHRIEQHLFTRTREAEIQAATTTAAADANNTTATPTTTTTTAAAAAATGAMTWTVLRPTFFFENLAPTAGFAGKVTATAWDAYLQGKPLQCVSVSDVGYFAAMALVRAAQFRNQCLSLAGDDLTYEHLQRTVRAKTGRPLPTTYRVLCYLVLWVMGDPRTMFTWFYDQGYGADIPRLRKLYPGLKNLDGWLEESEWVKKP
ncbi:NmrA-like family protein [Aspergillus saccharolyticus JOP 1030-1]|uniref:NmrA-like family protein n=1 Tax=Aspergillus saccharolyticus JOP 1030-1 TaxID=1450539 RepID=A0A318ZPP5_9EURO|nr:NmrA-like family protein [Aspergillus saccharolyticus JOP 1030-1]PYH49591.1 NmrA-like family protein [Aspergillus saccharolyticus JOP 1030-1]